MAVLANPATATAAATTDTAMRYAPRGAVVLLERNMLIYSAYCRPTSTK
jgi:hypothetical protein